MNTVFLTVFTLTGAVNPFRIEVGNSTLLCLHSFLVLHTIQYFNLITNTDTKCYYDYYLYSKCDVFLLLYTYMSVYCGCFVDDYTSIKISGET